MRLENYNTKLIVQSDKDLLIKRRLPITIEDTEYDFIIFEVRNAIIEFGVFIPYTAIEASNGPIERNLNDMLYHDIRNYEAFFSKNFFFKPEFVIDGEKYVLKMAGSGPVALKLVLELTYSEIDSSNRPIEKKLRNFIVSTYQYKMRNDPELENKFEMLLEKDKEKNIRQKKILDDVKENEKKTKEIEAEFDIFKPRDKSRYKIR